MSGVLDVSIMLFTGCITGNWLAICIHKKRLLFVSGNRLVHGFEALWKISVVGWMKFSVSMLFSLFRTKILISQKR